MKIEMQGCPRFWFPLTKDQLAALLKCSEAHYDAHCKAQSKVGGLLYGWKNRLEFGGPAAPVCAWWAELDSCLKILEQAERLHHGGELTIAQFEAAQTLRRCFHLAMDEANKMQKQWNVRYELA